MSPAQRFQATCPSSEKVGAEDRAAACARVRGCVPSASVICLPKRTRRNRKRYRDRRRAKAGDSAHTLMPDVDLRLEAPRSCVFMTPTAPPLPGPVQADAGRPSLQVELAVCFVNLEFFFFKLGKGRTHTCRNAVEQAHQEDLAHQGVRWCRPQSECAILLLLPHVQVRHIGALPSRVRARARVST